MVNPLLFVLLDRMLAKPEQSKAEPAKTDAVPDTPPTDEPPREELPVTQLTGHVVLVGHGRVGSFISEVLHKAGTPLLVIDDAARNIARAREMGLEAITGNAADPNVIQAANLAAARCLLVAIPDAFEGGQVVQQGRQINPALAIVARAHSDDEVEHLKKHGATDVIMAEHEIAKAMIADIPPPAPPSPQEPVSPPAAA